MFTFRKVSIAVLTVVAPLISPCCALSASASSASPGIKPRGPILVVGASGGTGVRTLNGLLDAGYDPGQIRVMTRNVDRPSMENLRGMGFVTVQADLDDPESGKQAIDDACAGCVGCYIHSTSSDTKKLDTKEVDRARTLAAAIARQCDAAAGVTCHVVFNSSAGEKDHGLYRITMKHNVERVFLDDCDGDVVPFTSLRANLFMEELWKGYTRPAILKGKFPFSVPSDRTIYLTSVRDMGRMAGACMARPNDTSGRIINVASDVLTAGEMADDFARAQGTPCRHVQNRLFALLARMFFRELYRTIRFYRRSTETTDVEALHGEFPGIWTSFPEFLEETNWGDRDLSFDDFAIVREKTASK